MKITKKSLQKFTNTEAKISKILALERITHEDLKPLSKEEQSMLFQQIGKEVNGGLEGEERERYWIKIEAILSQESKNQNWEFNHNRITYAISNLMQEYGRMPTKTEVAEKSGLSRQTVHKHLREFTTHPLYLEHLEQFKFMTDKVLARVFKYAVNGDVSAAKLFLSMMAPAGPKHQSKTLIQTQNNYIQINSTVLSQEILKQLSPEQLNSLEEVVKTALPQFKM